MNLTPEELARVLARKGDIHTASAAKALGIPEAEVTPAQRASAKALNPLTTHGTWRWPR